MIPTETNLCGNLFTDNNNVKSGFPTGLGIELCYKQEEMDFQIMDINSELFISFGVHSIITSPL